MRRGSEGGPRPFARRLLREWRLRGWPVRGERVLCAVSGGADSTALLLGLEELKRGGLLGVDLTAAHLDHGLRGEAGAEDARWVEGLARAYGFECVVGRAALSEGARENLEQAARRARYEFLAEAARACGARAVLAAHTLDDQAETVLLRLLRGSGAEGLAGMAPERALEAGGEVRLRRPLLSWARRADTEGFCRERGVEFRSDAMNEDERFARVRVRRTLLPLLETLNPRAAETLARTAALLREDSAALDALAAALLAEARPEVDESAGEGTSEEAAAHPLKVDALRRAAPALRRRVLRLWLARERGDLRRLSRAHLLGVERLLEGSRGGRVAELPGGARVERRRNLLHFRPAAQRKIEHGT
ncbi:MAG: tRNA lysidine(34) synthetase TilS [Acidobacteria bacterium]|nr:tRNA lysidine(34) synthetase TilS [Acidobacteriota bacterium]